MQNIQQFTIKLTKDQFPTAEKVNQVPKGYSLTFVKNIGSYKTQRHNQAKILAEHAEIVEESRHLLLKEKAIKWQDFVKKHASSKNK